MSIYQDQRKTSRTSISGEIQYSRAIHGDSFDARLFDCGTRGMGLISEFPYLKDTELFLKSKNDREDLVQKAKVAWSRPASKSSKRHPRYRVGVQFTS